MKIIKKICIAIAIIFVANTPVFADSARIVRVQPYYHDVYQNTNQLVCEDILVPIYGNSSSGDVITGMIVGGIIGNHIDNDNGTLIGAFLGGIMTSENNSNVIGSRIERKCQNILVQKPITQVAYYMVVYEWYGQNYSFETEQFYRIGDYIQVQPQVMR